MIHLKRGLKHLELVMEAFSILLHAAYLNWFLFRMAFPSWMAGGAGSFGEDMHYAGWKDGPCYRIDMSRHWISGNLTVCTYSSVPFPCTKRFLQALPALWFASVTLIHCFILLQVMVKNGPGQFHIPLAVYTHIRECIAERGKLKGLAAASLFMFLFFVSLFGPYYLFSFVTASIERFFGNSAVLYYGSMLLYCLMAYNMLRLVGVWNIRSRYELATTLLGLQIVPLPADENALGNWVGEGSTGISSFVWNSVDVRGSDGLLHHGRVIGAVTRGLVVNFGGTKESGSKLIPFGQVYRCKGSESFHARRIRDGPEVARDGMPVEVLVRQTSVQPWTWYPGMMIHYFEESGSGLVSVTMPDGDRKGIAAANRIRPRSTDDSLARLRVAKGQFSREAVVVRGVPLIPDAELLGTLNMSFREAGAWMMAVKVLSNVRNGLRKDVGILGIFDDREWLNRYVSGQGRPEDRLSTDYILTLLKKDRLKIPRTLSDKVPDIDGDIQSLCADELMFIFHCMDTLQQTKLKRVCTAWESVLSSASIQRVLVLAYSASSDTYEFSACLYHGWSHSTKIIIFNGVFYSDDDRLSSITRLLKRVMAERKLPALHSVLLANMEWAFSVNHENWMNALHGELVSPTEVCDTVLLRSVEAQLEFDSSDYDEGEETYVRIRMGRITSTMTVKDLWTILEGELPDMKATDTADLAEWIRGVTTAPTTDLWAVAHIINSTQTIDPRNGVRYRGITFFPYGSSSLASIDVKLLSRITLQKLLSHYRNRTEGLVIFGIDDLSL